MVAMADQEQLIPVPGVDLWAHQERGIAEVIRLIESGARRICLTSPTGGGKSVMIERIIQHLHGWPTSLYTNRNMLRDQLSRGFDRAGIDHGIRAAGVGTDFSQRVQISSIQTEHTRVYKRKTWDSLHPSKLIVVDEAHLMKEQVAQQLQEDHLKVKDAVWLGVTATPLDIGHMYDHLVVAGKTRELQACDALVQSLHYAPDEPDVEDLPRNVKTGEFIEKGVVKAIMSPNIFGRVLEHYKLLNPEQKPSMLFGPSVDGSLWFAEQFWKAGIPAAHIDGTHCWLNGKTYESDRYIRDAICEGSRLGEIKVICNRYVLREGIDLKWIEHLILATILGTLQSYLQVGGRGLRASPETGKTHLILQDHGGHWHRPGLGSLNVDREWDLSMSAKVEAAVALDKRRNLPEGEKPDLIPILCPVCKKVRYSGLTCPACKHVGDKRSRVVIQQDGRLKAKGFDCYRPQVVELKTDTQRKWEKVFWRCRKSGKTFAQAVGLFVHENHYRPPRDLKLMPLSDRPYDWHAKIDKVSIGALR